MVEDIQKADEDQLSEMRTWFFKENIRIMQEKQQLEESRASFEREKSQFFHEMRQQKMLEEIAQKHLEKEKELFDKKFEILQKELRELAMEKQKLEREKAVFKELKSRQRTQQQTTTSATPKLFFKGVNNAPALKKRYRDLIKIFHPDNMDGDTDALQNINKEYDSLKKVYCI